MGCLYEMTRWKFHHVFHSIWSPPADIFFFYLYSESNLNALVISTLYCKAFLFGRQHITTVPQFKAQSPNWDFVSANLETHIDG